MTRLTKPLVNNMGLTLEHIYLRDVFEDLTFTFETGKMTLLIGDTGAGGF